MDTFCLKCLRPKSYYFILDHQIASLLLADLPPEVITTVFSGLSRCDLFLTRQTCKLFHDSATPLIFQTRHVMIERRNLENLVMISRTPRLTPHIRSLQIHTLHLLHFDEIKGTEPSFDLNEQAMVRAEADRFDERDVSETVGPDDTSDLSDLSDTGDVSYTSDTSNASSISYASDTNRRRLHRERWREQQILLRSGYAYKCFLIAMSRLIRCRNIAFDSTYPPWGIGHLEASFGIPLQRSLANSRASRQFVYSLVRAVLVAAVASGLQTEFLGIDIGYCIDGAYCIPLDLVPHLPGPVPSLRRLHLVTHPCLEENKRQPFVNLFQD